MVRESGSSPRPGKESSGSFEAIETPMIFHKILKRITRSKKVNHASTQYTVDVVDGFEDILQGPLGDGLFYNTNGTVYQLAFALSVALTPEVGKIMQDASLANSSDVIKVLRDRQVLSGLKILDLGSGTVEFAVAAHSMGAEAYTADVEDLSKTKKSHISGHQIINLRKEATAEELVQAFGNNFDLVTENIIGGVPFSDVKPPEPRTIEHIAEVLLKQGGYLYNNYGIQHGSSLLRKV